MEAVPPGPQQGQQGGLMIGPSLRVATGPCVPPSGAPHAAEPCAAPQQGAEAADAAIGLPAPTPRSSEPGLALTFSVDSSTHHLDAAAARALASTVSRRPFLFLLPGPHIAPACCLQVAIWALGGRLGARRTRGEPNQLSRPF